MKRTLSLPVVACLLIVVCVAIVKADSGTPVFLEKKLEKINKGLNDKLEEVTLSPRARRYSYIGKWMLTYPHDDSVAHWLGELLGGKIIWEPINIIFMDGFATSVSNARNRMRSALISAGFDIRWGHSGGYYGKIASTFYSQEPSESEHAFSDAHWTLKNNHGRMFGVHVREGVYYYTGAFSRESGTFHHYISFNTARNAMADNLDDYTIFKKGEKEWLSNKYNTATDTTGDHDGYAILIAAQDPYEPNNNSEDAKWINDEPQKHSISPCNDVDWSKFTISGTRDVIIETSGPSGHDTRMWLYNFNLLLLAYDDDGGIDFYSKITETLDSGIYYIKIDEYNQNNLIPLYELELTVSGTGRVEDGEATRTVDAIERFQISPNPFDSRTDIKFSIGHPDRRTHSSYGTGSTESIELKIYDVSGRMVKSFNLTSPASFREAGRAGILSLASAVVWDGSNNMGHQLPAGIYFVRLTTPGQTYTEKVILLK